MGLGGIQGPPPGHLTFSPLLQHGQVAFLAPCPQPLGHMVHITFHGDIGASAQECFPLAVPTSLH